MEFHRSDVHAKEMFAADVVSQRTAKAATGVMEPIWIGADQQEVTVDLAQVAQALDNSAFGIENAIITRIADSCVNFTLRLQHGETVVELSNSDQTLLRQWPSVMREALRQIYAIGYVIFRVPDASSGMVPSIMNPLEALLQFNETVDVRRRYWVVNARMPSVPIKALVFVKHPPLPSGRVRAPGAVSIPYSIAMKELDEIQMSAADSGANPVYVYQMSKELLHNSLPTIGLPDEHSRGDARKATMEIFEHLVQTAGDTQQMASEISNLSAQTDRFLVSEETKRRTGSASSGALRSFAPRRKLGSNYRLVPPGQELNPGPPVVPNASYQAQLDNYTKFVCSTFGISPHIMWPDGSGQSAESVLAMSQWNRLIERNQKDLEDIIDNMFRCMYRHTLETYAREMAKKVVKKKQRTLDKVVSESLRIIKQEREQRLAHIQEVVIKGTDTAMADGPEDTTAAAAAARPKPLHARDNTDEEPRKRTATDAADDTDAPAKADDGSAKAPDSDDTDGGKIITNDAGDLQLEETKPSMIAAARLFELDPDRVQLEIVSKFKLVISFETLPLMTVELINTMHEKYAISTDQMTEMLAATAGLSMRRMLHGKEQREAEAKERKKLADLIMPPEEMAAAKPGGGGAAKPAAASKSKDKDKKKEKAKDKPAATAAAATSTKRPKDDDKSKDDKSQKRVTAQAKTIDKETK